MLFSGLTADAADPRSRTPVITGKAKDKSRETRSCEHIRIWVAICRASCLNLLGKGTTIFWQQIGFYIVTILEHEVELEGIYRHNFRPELGTYGVDIGALWGRSLGPFGPRTRLVRPSGYETSAQYAP